MLAICSEFFDDLNARGIRYCHWKSNEHLAEAVDGKTDLDVLVDDAQQAQFLERLEAHDFRRILSQPDKRFPGLEDYLGFDPSSGALIHLHVHYRLILGQRFIKNHHLPLESLLLDNRIDRFGVSIPCPEIELLLLIIRAHMKVDLVSLMKHAIKDILGQRYTAFPRDIEEELRVLFKRADWQKFAKYLELSQLPISLDHSLSFLKRLDAGKLRAYQIGVGHVAIRRRLRGYRRETGPGVSFSYFRHYLSSTRLAGAILRVRRKTLPEHGCSFAIVGADGSGKSTLVEDLANWMSWKMTVKTHYFGIPKSRLRSALSLLTRAFVKLGMPAFARRTGDLLWLYVGYYRSKVSREISVQSARGAVSIVDRFPMPEFRSMAEPMDSPRIREGTRVLGMDLFRIEQSLYQDITWPNRIFVLKVDLEELRRRKSDLAYDKHAAKAKAVNGLTNGPSIEVIDANRPYDDVLLDLKKRIWTVIGSCERPLSKIGQLS